MSSKLVRSLSLLALVAACSSDPAPAPALPDAVKALGMKYAFAPMDSVVCAGQPTEAQFDGLKKAGVTRVLHLRLPKEKGTGWEEERAKDAGVAFTRLEIQGGDGLTRDNVDTFAKWLAEPHEGITMVSCGSSNRVGALFALKAAWLDGKSTDEAIALGKSAGMTRLEPIVKELLAKDQ